MIYLNILIYKTVQTVQMSVELPEKHNIYSIYTLFIDHCFLTDTEIKVVLHSQTQSTSRMFHKPL